MGTRSSRTAVLFLILSGCTAAVPEPKLPPDGLSWLPETPFRSKDRVDIPADAVAINHFLRAQMLLGEGDFDGALKEFESALGPIPTMPSCAFV